MKTPNERILRLIDLLKFQKTVKNLQKFCDEIGIVRQTIYKIKNGDASFTIAQIEKIGELYNVNFNWIFGFETKVFRSDDSIELV